MTLDTAEFSPCGRYRYTLTRELGGRSEVAFVMLNPSTADAATNDPTIRRCMGYAARWGYGRLRVVNLYAYRATDPAVMWWAAREGVDVVGRPENDLAIRRAVVCADLVVLAWGVHADRSRSAEVAELVESMGRAPVCLGFTAGGEPRHPLMMRADVELKPFARPGAPFLQADPASSAGGVGGRGERTRRDRSATAGPGERG